MNQTIRLSIGMFTILPLAPRGEFRPTPKQIRGMILCAPVVGLLMGLGLAIGLFLIREGITWLQGGEESLGINGLSALLTIGLLVLVTGGLHWDGLADTVDAMACRKDRPGALEVMRRSDVGPLGVITVVIVLLIQIMALTVAVERGHATIAIMTGVIAGRLSAVWACRMHAARPDGQGSWVARSTNKLQASIVTGASLLVPLLLIFLDNSASLTFAVLGIMAIPAALVLAGLLQRWWVQRFGGITGDTLGAGIEICTATALVIVALAP